MQKKKILILVFSILLLTAFGATAIAIDLPIDIGAIRRQREERQDALSVRWGIDLFSENSDARIETGKKRQEHKIERAKKLIFQEEHTFIKTDPNVALFKAAENNEMLFIQPVQVRTIMSVEEDSEISMWIIIPVIVTCAGIGFLIALRRKARRKEKNKSVHNHHTGSIWPKSGYTN
ncbi:MAG: hypothetical protein FWD38_06255 [Oscillospiraceae bacterium]|nr:hypothetical protein [Oscillospiraceae bacterium]